MDRNAMCSENEFDDYIADMILQLTNQAGECQVNFTDKRPYAMSINMGGNDKTVVSFVMRAS